LRNKLNVPVELINGNRGELTVSVDGKVVAQKGESLPDIDEVLTAVRSMEPTAVG
jgi:hypothetical protein